jgi:hypothetical protein
MVRSEMDQRLQRALGALKPSAFAGAHVFDCPGGARRSAPADIERLPFPPPPPSFVSPCALRVCPSITDRSYVMTLVRKPFPEFAAELAAGLRAGRGDGRCRKNKISRMSA